MARQRQRKPKQTQQVEVVEQVETLIDAADVVWSATNGTQERKGIKMALTPEQIQALLGKTRSKGQYVVLLNQFLASGEGGVNAHDEWVEIRDKAATTVKQGFENAKQNKEAAEGSEFVKVITNEEKVFLINLKAAGAEVEAA